ncbi:MAG: hypothetical protein WAQ05_19240 [Rubrivivax sp.]
MLRTKTFVETTTGPKTDEQRPEGASGLRAIDPADFQHIGGGAPRGGWLDAVADGLVLSEDSVAAPRGGW